MILKGWGECQLDGKMELVPRITGNPTRPKSSDIYVCHYFYHIYIHNA